jgi:acyl carrier protein
VNDNVTTRVRDVIAEHFRVDADRLTDEARLRDDLGADWLDRLELMIAIEDQVAGVEIDDVLVDRVHTVGDLMRLVEGVLSARPGAYDGRHGFALGRSARPTNAGTQRFLPQSKSVNLAKAGFPRPRE